MTAGPIRAVQQDSPAAAAGLQPGERIAVVDGAPAGDLLTLDARLRRMAGREVACEVVAPGGASRTVEITPREVTWIEEPRWPASPVSVASLGIAIPIDAMVAAVEPGSAAAAAGLRVGERVVRVRFVEPDEKQAEPDAGLELSANSPSWPYVMAVLQQVPALTRVQLVVEGEDGLNRDIELAPTAVDDRFVVDRGLLFEPVYKLVKADSVAAAFARGGRRTVEDLSLVYRFLGKLTSNQISPRLLGGPIEIAKQAGRSAEEGFSRLLLFLTMLSANLAVVNFLPIPVLDGGHMVFLLYEWIRGKPPSEGVVAALSYMGLALILTLMMFVFGLDLGLIPRR
jgi:regulator of sigma E protease